MVDEQSEILVINVIFYTEYADKIVQSNYKYMCAIRSNVFLA